MSRLSPKALRGVDTVGHQVAALCWRRRDDRVEVLLITSRDTGRWVLPKGWPMSERAPHEAAAQEAWEEAGVRGVARADCLGFYSYLKERTAVPALACMVEVYPLEVSEMTREFPEKGQRKLKWQRPARAATRVVEPELAALIAGFDPDRDPRDGA